MAQSTASYAAGDMGMGLYGLGDESRTIKGKKRRTVFAPAARPLFAAEADFRASKVFTRVKKGMLALYGTNLHVVDVIGLEAADVASGIADVTAHVLRWVNIADLLQISFTGPATLKIEHGDTSDKPKVRGMGGDSLAAASEEDLTPGQSFGGASVASTAAGSPSSTSIRVTYDSFTLTFRDAGIAQRAAAVLLFQQAQYAAVRHWLRNGLHVGFRCDLVSVSALPLLFDDSQHPTHTSGPGGFGSKGLARSHSLLPPHVLYSCASGSYGRTSLSGGAGSGAGAAGAGSAAAVAAYPWGEAAMQDWGCSVPLPAGWAPVLDAAASSGVSVSRDDEQGVTPEELTCPVVLQHGPKAIQVTISTPLGAAVATITPQLAKAALQHSTCRDILALPLHPCSSSSSAAPMAAFSWSVQGNVPTSAGAAAGVEGSTGSSSNVSGAGMSTDVDEGTGSVSSAGASGSTGGLPLMHTLDAFAAVTVQIVRTPAAANTKGVGKVFDPEAIGGSGPSAERKRAPAAANQMPADSGGAGTRGGSSSVWQSNTSLQVQLAVCAVLAALALQQSSGILVLLLQLLLLAAMAGAAVITAKSSSSSSIASSSRRLPAHSSAGQQQPAAGAQQISDSSSSENVRCCGWSIMLVTADLCSAPSRHLQLQVSLAKASRGMARLRLRMASMSTGGAPMALLGAPSDDDESLPVLVSEPEPIWLNTDTKQRFINAKSTIEASQEQARRTHKWRQQMDVDTVLMRPCPKFPLMCRLFPTYLLSDSSPEGHSVVLMKVGGVKDLCDAIFQTPEGSPEGLTLLEAEHTLALLNEYLVQVAAPMAMPAGFQVQIYDFAGFKLSYVMGDFFKLYKMLVRFGLYYPERLHQALVINAPSWFSTPWKAMSAFLDENTSAKVMVVGNPKSALSTLAHHLGGIENVPEAWGGKCNLPLEEYPSNVCMMDFGMRLNAGEKPFPGLQRC